MNATHFIDLKDVNFSYGNRKILNDINLTIQPGDFFCIAGKSGVGKSTLLYILGGFLRPDSGTYFFNNKSVYRHREFGLGRFRKKNIGFVFQDFRLLSFLNIKDNIRFPSYFGGKKIQKNRIEDLLKLLGLEDRQKAFPKDISGGEAQRTAIARALYSKPAILLLDEPTGNLDQATELEILNILKELQSQGLALVCVSHSPKVLAAGDKIFDLIEQGLVERKTKAATISKAKNVETKKQGNHPQKKQTKKVKRDTK